MIVIRRLVGERIQIGPHIQVEVQSVRGREVQLTIHAPDDVPVRRLEQGDGLEGKGAIGWEFLEPKGAR